MVQQRLTNPAIRELLMYPRNRLQRPYAMLSLVPSAMDAKAPIWRTPRLFRPGHDLACLAALPLCTKPGRQRRHLLAHVGPVMGADFIAGTT